MLELKHTYPEACKHDLVWACKTTYMATFGQRLRAALTHAKLQEGDLARGLGVSVQAVYMVLNGTTKAMTAENAALAARLLGVSIFWLATGKGKMIGDDGVLKMSCRWPFRRISLASIRGLSRHDLADLDRRLETVVAGYYAAYPPAQSPRKSDAG